MNTGFANVLILYTSPVMYGTSKYIGKENQYSGQKPPDSTRFLGAFVWLNGKYGIEW